MGKYEGDPFETMFIRIDKGDSAPTTASTSSSSAYLGEEKAVMNILMEMGQEVQFDLSAHSHIYEIGNDPTSFVLNHRKNIIIFKVRL